MTVGDFAELVDIVCQLHGGSVISGRRSVAHNDDVGGLPGSLHLVSLAVDVLFDDPTELDAAKVTVSRLGLHWHESGWRSLHIQALPVLSKAQLERGVTHAA